MVPGRARVLHVVGPERSRSARPSARAIRRGRARIGARAGRGCCPTGWARKSFSAMPNPGAGAKGTRPSVSTSTMPRTRSPRSPAKRAAMAPPSAWPASTGGDGQVCSISSSIHSSTRPASSGPSATSQPPCPGKVGSDHAMRARKRRHHRGPVCCVGAGPVQQDQRRALAALDAGVEIPASVIRRSAAGISASSRWRAVIVPWAVVSMRPNVRPRRGLPASPVRPNLSPRRAWVNSPSQTEPCSYAYAVAAAREGTRNFA